MPNEAARVAAAALPVIDITHLASSDPAARRQVAEAIRAACLDKGFFYVVGHGVQEALIAAAFAETRGFFSQPEAVKAEVDKALSACNRGYERLRGQTLEPGAPPDLKEGFYIGVELPPDDPRVAASRFNRGPNQWPAAPEGFRPAMEAYFQALLALGERLMRGLALSLDLAEDHFEAYCRNPLATLRLLHYPPHPPDAAADEKGAGAHTDFGGLTLLMQDDRGGLQVWDADTGGWIHAPPLPGAYLVNLGDLITRWTNGRYRSTLHRVVNSSGADRYSIPFFHVGNPDHEVVSLIVGEAALYPPTTVEAHLRERYRLSYS